MSREHVFIPNELERPPPRWPPEPPPPVGAEPPPAGGAGVPVPPPPVPPPAGAPSPPDGGAGAPAGGDEPPEGAPVGPPPKPEAEADPHSRSPMLRSASRLRFEMSRASARLPYSQLVNALPMPVTRCSASRTRSCAHVNATFGPRGMSISAERSPNESCEKKGPVAAATRRAPPRSSEF